MSNLAKSWNMVNYEVEQTESAGSADDKNEHDQVMNNSDSDRHDEHEQLMDNQLPSLSNANIWAVLVFLRVFK